MINNHTYQINRIIKFEKNNVICETSCNLIHVNKFIKLFKSGFMEYKCKWIQTKRKSEKHHREFICTIPMSFDIETTKYNDEISFMYGWQFGFDCWVIWGETWKQLIQLLDTFKSLIPNEEDVYKFIIFNMNLSFEYMFMKHYITITDSFFKEKNAPQYIVHDNHFVFHECISWGGSLEGLAKNYTNLVKLKGDLDYSIYRESYNDFTNEQEWNYIIFDVLILNEFHKYYMNEYVIPTHKTPLSVQSYIRNEIERKSKIYHKNANHLQFEDVELYDEFMSFCYRGGYVHGNMAFANRTITREEMEIISVDFTSSYPSSILNCVNIVSKPLLVKGAKGKSSKLLDAYNEYYGIGDNDNHRHGYFVKISFKGLETKRINGLYMNNIESLSKCVSYSNVKCDNGRIYKGNITVILTELDYLNYCRFYEWKSSKIEYMYEYRLGWLPRYIVDVMVEPYTEKFYQKINHENYMPKKVVCNSIYGVTVTKRPQSSIEYDETTHTAHPPLNEEGEPIEENQQELYEKFIKKNNPYKDNTLSCIYGCYISAWSRYNLLQNVADLEESGNVVLYCDTDSIKFWNRNNGLKIIDEYNKKQREIVLKRCKDLKLDVNVFAPRNDGDVIGAFDREYVKGIDKFKMLGCKRYIIESAGEQFVTCAGLPKKAYKDYINENNLDFFDAFEEGLKVEGCKKTHVYNEDYNVIQGKKGLIEIPSNITLNDSDFTLSINGDYKMLLDEFNEIYESVDVKSHNNDVFLDAIAKMKNKTT